MIWDEFSFVSHRWGWGCYGIVTEKLVFEHEALFLLPAGLGFSLFSLSLPRTNEARTNGSTLNKNIKNNDL